MLSNSFLQLNSPFRALPWKWIVHLPSLFCPMYTFTFLLIYYLLINKCSRVKPLLFDWLLLITILLSLCMHFLLEFTSFGFVRGLGVLIFIWFNYHLCFAFPFMIKKGSSTQGSDKSSSMSLSNAFVVSLFTGDS